MIIHRPDSTPSRAPEGARSPLCPEAAVDLVWSRDVEAFCRRWEADYGFDIRPEFRGETHFHLCRCRRSRLEFFHPTHIAGSSELYRQLQSIQGYYRPDRWEHGWALNLLSPRSRLLEVGCGEGRFLERARDAGHEVIGLELNPNATRIAVDKGLKVTTRLLKEALPEMGGQCDAVAAFHVLEHTPDPLTFLREMLALLRPGGLCLVAVPDGDGYSRGLDDPWDMPPHHMLRWNRAALQFLGQRLPLDLEDLANEPLGVGREGDLFRAMFAIPAGPKEATTSWWQRRRTKWLRRSAEDWVTRHSAHDRYAGQSLCAAWRVRAA